MISDLTTEEELGFKFDLQRFAEEGDDDGEGNEGDSTPAWMSQLPEEYKTDEYGKGYKTMGEFYKTHKGLRAKLDGIPKPPDKADGYEFNKPEDIDVNPETEKWFRKTAFALKIPKETAGKLYDEFNKMVVTQVKGQTKKNEAEATKNDELMHGEWGEDYDKNIKLADKGIEDLGGEDLKKLLDDTGLSKNPVILKAFKQVGFEHGEDTIREGVVSGSSTERTLDDEYPSMSELPPDRQ